MFKIVLKGVQERSVVVYEERVDRFIGKHQGQSLPHYPGVEVHEEFLKTHWERAEEWQDVTGELKMEVKNREGQYLQDLKYEELNIGSVIGDYRFVKVVAYVIPKDGVDLKWMPLECWNRLQDYRTTLLRVERKAE